MPDRKGTSVVETLVALLVGLMVLHLTLDVLARGRVVQARIAEQLEWTQALRITRVILRRELSRGVPGRDWTLRAPDSLRLRAFRGAARVCRTGADSLTLNVLYGGVRRPDPRKDSVLVLTGDGKWTARDLVEVGPPTGSCDPPSNRPPERWQMDAGVQGTAVLARVFETGSYHIVDRALRYRPGLSGRQPISAEVLGSPASGFEAFGPAVWVRLESRLSGARPWVGSLDPGSRR
jgi:hypothetical protein